MSEILGELYTKQGKYEEGLRAFDAYFASTEAPSADARYKHVSLAREIPDIF